MSRTVDSSIGCHHPTSGVLASRHFTLAMQKQEAKSCPRLVVQAFLVSSIRHRSSKGSHRTKFWTRVC